MTSVDDVDPLIARDLRRLIAEGYAFDELVEEVERNGPWRRAFTLHERRIVEGMARDLWVTGEHPKGPSRPRTIPDFEVAYRAAVRALKERGTKLTWENVATEIQSERDITCSQSTVRAWAKEDGLPGPSELGQTIGR